MKAGSRCAIAGFLCSAAAFALASFLAPDVAVRETVRDNLVYHSQLTAGIDTVLVNITEEDAGEEIHEEITEVLNEGVVQNTIPGYDWNTMAIANVEESVNVRAEANEESEMVGKLYRGCAVTITGGEGSWTQVQAGEVSGWVSDEFLLFGAEAEAFAQEVGTYQATVSGEALRIRLEPSEEAGVYDLAEIGSSYTVTEQLEGWVGVQVEDDQVGYLSADYVTVEYRLGEAKTAAQIEAEEEKAKEEKAAKERQEAEEAAESASASDVAILAALVQLEAGGESYEGKLAVASVVMNRVRSGAYPNSVSGVVYQSGQFPPASSARMAQLVANGASADCVKAAKQAIGGVSNVGGLMHFHAARLGGSLVIGNHAFY